MIETLSKAKNLINFSTIKQLQFQVDHYNSQIRVPEYLLIGNNNKMMLQMHYKINSSHH